jgi:hypothetical protein
MGFIADALEYVTTEAVPAWEERQERRDDYVPRTLIPYRETDRQDDGSAPLFGYTKVKDKELIDRRQVAILGRAGSGKSYLLDTVYKGALDCFVELEGEAPLPLYLDCSGYELPSSNAIDEALQIRPAGNLYERVADEHPHGVHFFLDEADTRIRQTPAFAADLERGLKRVESDVGELHFLMTSRASEWGRLSRLQRLAQNGELDVVAFPEKPIGGEYSYLIRDAERREAFFEKCRNRGYSDLLALAFDGFELARTFNNTGHLPATREELWDQRIDARLVKSEAAIEVTQAPSRHRLRSLARLIACISHFSGKSTWSIRDAINDLGASLVGHEQPVTPSEVNWLLQSRLFTLAEGDRYQFVHNRYRDKLAAEILGQIKPRKQRLLLHAGEVDGVNRVVPELRTVAATLATTDARASFRNYLIEREPEIAVFGSLPRLNLEQKKDLLRAVIGWARRGHHPPSTEIQGIGEDIGSALSRHRPSDPAFFLKKYLQSSSDIERLWSVDLTTRWNAASDLSDLLAEIAEDEEEAVRTRKRALEALGRTDDPKYSHVAENLVGHSDDEIRGYALTAWRMLGDISPSEYVPALSKERGQTSLYGRLLNDPVRYAQGLGKTELEAAFRALDEETMKTSDDRDQLRELNSLHQSLLRGLLDRVSEVSDVQVSVSLVVDYFTSVSGRHVADDELRTALDARPDLWQDILNDVVGRADELDLPYADRFAKILADTTPTDHDVDLPDEDDAAFELNAFLEPLRKSTGSSQTSTTDSQIDGSTEDFSFLLDVGDPSENKKPLPSNVTREVVNERIQSVLSENTGDDSQRATEVIKEIWRILARVDDPSTNAEPYQVARLGREDVAQTIDLLDDDLRDTVDSIFKNGFSSIAQSLVARPVISYLLKRDFPLSTSTIVEFLKAPRWWGDSTQSEVEMEALLHLRNQNRGAWKQVVDHLTNPTTDSPNQRQALQHLLDCGDAYYLAQAERRLRGADYQHRGEWKRLITYILQHEPKGTNEILVAAYQASEAKRHLIDKTTPPRSLASDYLDPWDLVDLLFQLINRGDERGWLLLEDRLDAGQLPVTDRTRYDETPVPKPKTSFHLEIFARWYKFIRKARDRADLSSNYTDGSYYDILAGEVIERIVKHASPEAFRTVRRLQNELEAERDFKGVERLGSRRLDAEYEYLAGTRELYPPQRLLEFLLTDYFHLVQSDRDLFEVLLQVLDDIQQDFDEGRGVAGFWEPVPESDPQFQPLETENLTCTAQPKGETECQNVLWGLTRPRLQAYGVTEIEEDFVGPNRADLRLEYGEPGKPPRRTYLELKVAHRGYSYAPGSSNNLIDPLEGQLWEKYLRPTGVKYGVYAVIWARDPDRYAWPRKKHYASPVDLEEALQSRADQVKEKHDAVIIPRVLDVSAPYRS